MFAILNLKMKKNQSNPLFEPELPLFCDLESVPAFPSSKPKKSVKSPKKPRYEALFDLNHDPYTPNPNLGVAVSPYHRPDRHVSSLDGLSPLPEDVYFGVAFTEESDPDWKPDPGVYDLPLGLA